VKFSHDAVFDGAGYSIMARYCCVAIV